MKTLLINRVQAFVPAFNGLFLAFKKEAAMKVHVAATCVVILSILLCNFSFQKNLLLLLACAGVIVVELVNSAIEKLCDLYSKNPDPDIKWIKDVSAAAVLISLVSALLIAVYVILG